MGREEIAKTLYVSDLDGTLLNSDSKVSDASVEMLNKAISLGAKFTVATARTPATVVPLLKDVARTLPAVVMTGSAIWNFEESKFMRPQFMNGSTLKRMLSAYRDTGVSCYVYFLNRDNARLDIYHVGGVLTERERKFMEERFDSPVKTFHVPESGESVLPADMNRALLLFSQWPDPSQKVLSDIIARDFPDITPVYYHEKRLPGAELEVFSATTSKAAALKSVVNEVGAERIVAFGDNINDLPLLRMADVAVAVGNAVDEVKAVADIVIGENDSDAVARFILEDVGRVSQ